MLALKRRNEEIARHRPATNERTNERRLVYLKISLSEAIRLRFCTFPKEDGRKTTGRGKATSWSQFSKHRKEEVEKKRKRRASPSHDSGGASAQSSLQKIQDKSPA